jgi:hypothetical protein
MLFLYKKPTSGRINGINYLLAKVVFILIDIVLIVLFIRLIDFKFTFLLFIALLIYFFIFLTEILIDRNLNFKRQHDIGFKPVFYRNSPKLFYLPSEGKINKYGSKPTNKLVFLQEIYVAFTEVFL